MDISQFITIELLFLAAFVPLAIYIVQDKVRNRGELSSLKTEVENLETRFTKHEDNAPNVLEDLATVKADVKHILKKLDKMNGNH